MMVTASMFTNLKQVLKFEVNTTDISNQLKLCNTRICIQLYLRNLGLHPKNVFATLVTVYPVYFQKKHWRQVLGLVIWVGCYVVVMWLLGGCWVVARWLLSGY